MFRKSVGGSPCNHLKPELEWWGGGTRSTGGSCLDFISRCQHANLSGNGLTITLSLRVTAPQLTLLETVMRKIERVDVWIMNSGGQALDVFNVRHPVVLCTSPSFTRMDTFNARHCLPVYTSPPPCPVCRPHCQDWRMEDV